MPRCCSNSASALIELGFIVRSGPEGHGERSVVVAFGRPVLHVCVEARVVLAKKGHAEADVDKMHQAWFKAVTMTAVLWSQPYVPAQDY